MKELLLLSNTAFSIEKFRLHYLEKLSQIFKISIYTPNKIKINVNNYKNISCNYFGLNNFWKDILVLNRILKKNKNIDLILVYSFKYQFYIFLLNFFYKFKIINIIAGKGSLFLLQNKFLIIIRDIFFYFFFTFSDNFIFINREDAFFFRKKFRISKNIFTIPTEGIEIINSKQSKLNNKNFLFFSRLIMEKGILEFIELAKKIHQKFSNTIFFIAGSYDKKIIGQSENITKKNLIALIKKYNFIRYLGFKKSNIQNFLPTMDCLVSPSYAEGAGQSVMECVLSGLYAIVYKNSGHKYILNNNKKLICKNNSVKELYNLTCSFIKQNKNVSKKIITNAQNYIRKNFDSSIVYKKFLDILVKILDEKKLVSICLASYNQEKYIVECLDSILKQSYSNIEILISDDYSNDGTFEKIKKFYLKNKDHFKIKIFRQNKNIGISKNFNFLYKYASGDYIVFFGGDDMMKKEKIKKQVRTLNLNPNSSFCYSNCDWIFQDKKLLNFQHFNFFHRPPNELVDLLPDYNIPSPTIMINRKYIDQNPFDERLKYFSDFKQIVELWNQSKPVYIPERLVIYRRHNESLISTNKFNNERLFQISLIKKLFKRNKYYQQQVDKNLNIYFYHNIINNNVTANHNFKHISFLLYNLKSIRGIVRLFFLLFFFIMQKELVKKN